VLCFKYFQKYLRNRTIAYIFAIKQLQINMRRDIYQAIADPTRRAILMLLAVSAMTPNALAGHFGSSRQAVSKHIQILAECGAVDQEQRGREIFYQLNIDKMKEIDHWMEAFRKLWETRFDQLDNLLNDL
jgi:DNA-binding transcriptional ArsR family regulator